MFGVALAFFHYFAHLMSIGTIYIKKINIYVDLCNGFAVFVFWPIR